MTKREYIKYHQEIRDCQGKLLVPGDVVVINNNYSSNPYIGVVDHFTESGNVVILYDWTDWRCRIVKCWAYRRPSTVVKLRSGRRKKK